MEAPRVPSWDRWLGRGIGVPLSAVEGPISRCQFVVGLHQIMHAACLVIQLCQLLNVS